MFCCQKENKYTNKLCLYNENHRIGKFIYREKRNLFQSMGIEIEQRKQI